MDGLLHGEWMACYMACQLSGEWVACLLHGIWGIEDLLDAAIVLNSQQQVLYL